MELNENIVGNLSDLFNIDKEIVTDALTNKEADSSFIDNWKSSNVIKSKADFDTFQENLINQAKTDHITELKEKAKSKELPQELYSFFKGNVSEELERKLAKAASISEYDNYEDLVTKVLSSKSQDEGLKTQIEELQKRNQTLNTEKENAITEAQGKFDSELIKNDKNAVFNSLDLDYADEAKAKQLQLLKSQVDSNFTYKRENGTTLIFKDGQIVKDQNTLVPLTLDQVVLDVAKEFDFKIKSPESGGQGGTSSQSQSGASGLNWEDFLESKGVEPNTNEADKLWVEYKNANK